MVHRFLGALLLLLPVSVGGCLLDATVEQTSGSSGDVTSTTSGEGGQPSGATSTTSSASTSGSGGAGGAPDTCRNGELESTETCEDGNDVAGDGTGSDSCTACDLEMAVCGNALIEPGELCDHTGADCATCAIPTGSACATATLLSPGASFGGPTTGAAFGVPGASGGCGSDTPDTTKVFKYQTGPFPEGIRVQIANAAQSGGSPDPMVWIDAGCGTLPLTCRSDWNDPSTAVRSGVVPPRTTLFVGVSDHYGATAMTFDGTFRQYRNFWVFGADEEGWDLGTGDWYYSGSYRDLEVYSYNDAPEDVVTAPPTYIGGLGSAVRVELDYGLRYTSVLGQLHFAFDDGTQITENLVATSGASSATFDVPRPPNTEWLTVSAGFTNQADQYADMWIYNVFVGPVP